MSLRQTNLGLQATQETGLVPSPSELDLVRRTGPMLLGERTEASREALFGAQAGGKTLRAKPESQVESVTSIFALLPTISEARAVDEQSRPIGRNERPKPECRFESATSITCAQGHKEVRRRHHRGGVSRVRERGPASRRAVKTGKQSHHAT